MGSGATRVRIAKVSYAGLGSAKRLPALTGSRTARSWVKIAGGTATPATKRAGGEKDVRTEEVYDDENQARSDRWTAADLGGLLAACNADVGLFG
jgi:hypothetical protein